MVGLGTDIGDIADYVSHNDLGTAVLLRELARARFGGRLVLASSMVVYGEGRYACAEHGLVRAGPRREADLAAGRFEPPCPACGAPLRAAQHPRGRAAGSAQRLRRDEAAPGAPRGRVQPRDRRARDGPALPQRLRPADAARHALRRRRVDLRERARGRARAARVRGRRPAARLRPRARRGARERPRAHRARARARRVQRRQRHAAQRRRDGRRAARRERRPARLRP